MEEKIISIDGMMCQNCAKHVTNALMALESVEECVVNLDEGTATVTVTDSYSEEELAAAVEEEGYTVLGIE